MVIHGFTKVNHDFIIAFHGQRRFLLRFSLYCNVLFTSGSARHDTRPRTWLPFLLLGMSTWHGALLSMTRRMFRDAEREERRLTAKNSIMRSKHVLRELPESLHRSSVLSRRAKAVASCKKAVQMDSVLVSANLSPSKEQAMPLLTKRCSPIDGQYTETVELLESSSSRRKNVILTDGRLSLVRAAWILHFLLAIIVLGVGIWFNQQSRKYIPIFPPSRAGSDCERAFLNVMASSKDEDEAVICCKNKELSESDGLINALTSICPSEVCFPCEFLLDYCLIQ